MKAANQIIEFVQVQCDVGAVVVLKRFKLLKCGVNISVGKAIVAIEEILPSSSAIVSSPLFYLDADRATACGGFQLLINQLVVMPMKIRCGIGGGARANRMLHTKLPFFGRIVPHKFIVKRDPMQQVCR